MDQIKEPTEADDSRELWRIVARLVRIINNLSNLQVSLDGQQNKLTLADGNARLDLKLGGATPVTVDWCEGTAQGKRLALLGDFKPGS